MTKLKRRVIVGAEIDQIMGNPQQNLYQNRNIKLTKYKMDSLNKLLFI